MGGVLHGCSKIKARAGEWQEVGSPGWHPGHAASAQSGYRLSASKMCVMLGKFLTGEMSLSHRIPVCINPQ